MRDYFGEANYFANENYSNFDGNEWRYFEDRYDYMDDYNYANGATNFQPAASLPFVLNVANSTTDDVSNVVILGANENLYGATNFGNAAAITITMDDTNVTYTSFMESIKSEPFKVGLIQLESSNSSQPYKKLEITQKDPNGRVLTTPISPVKDPMQNQAGVTNVKYQFTVNGWTKITTTILASATLTVRLYPMEQIDVARGLHGRNVAKGYAQPNLSQYLPVINRGIAG